MSEFLIFNQELIALLKAGLPVVRSFEILLERQKSPTLRRVLTDVRTRVNSGSSISEAFAAEGDLFPRLYWTSLKAGRRAARSRPCCAATSSTRRRSSRCRARSSRRWSTRRS